MNRPGLSLLEKPLLYFAAPLFSAAERYFNETISEQLSQLFTVYLPQRDGGLYTELVEQGMTAEEAARRIFAIDTKAIQQCRLVLAVLDGRAIDEGVALELGYAYALGKPCYALQTDPRRLLPFGNNPMISGVLTRTFATVHELLESISSVVAHDSPTSPPQLRAGVEKT